jgi:hypothetical protein
MCAEQRFDPCIDHALHGCPVAVVISQRRLTATFSRRQVTFPDAAFDGVFRLFFARGELVGDPVATGDRRGFSSGAALDGDGHDGDDHHYYGSSH